MLVRQPAHLAGIAHFGAVISWPSGGPGTGPSDPTKTRAWRALRDAVVRDEPVCWLRFPGICTGASTTADHVVPKTVRPELAMARSNLRGACEQCNLARGRTPVERIAPAGQPPALSVFD